MTDVMTRDANELVDRIMAKIHPVRPNLTDGERAAQRQVLFNLCTLQFQYQSEVELSQKRGRIHEELVWNDPDYVGNGMTSDEQAVVAYYLAFLRTESPYLHMPKPLHFRNADGIAAKIDKRTAWVTLIVEAKHAAPKDDLKRERWSSELRSQLRGIEEDLYFAVELVKRNIGLLSRTVGQKPPLQDVVGVSWPKAVRFVKQSSNVRKVVYFPDEVKVGPSIFGWETRNTKFSADEVTRIARNFWRELVVKGDATAVVDETEVPPVSIRRAPSAAASIQPPGSDDEEDDMAQNSANHGGNREPGTEPPFLIVERKDGSSGPLYDARWSDKDQATYTVYLNEAGAIDWIMKCEHEMRRAAFSVLNETAKDFPDRDLREVRERLMSDFLRVKEEDGLLPHRFLLASLRYKALRNRTQILWAGMYSKQALDALEGITTPKANSLRARIGRIDEKRHFMRDNMPDDPDEPAVFVAPPTDESEDYQLARVTNAGTLYKTAVSFYRQAKGLAQFVVNSANEEATKERIRQEMASRQVGRPSAPAPATIGSVLEPEAADELMAVGEEGDGWDCTNPDCNNHNDPDDNFCANCRTAAPAPVAANEPEPEVATAPKPRKCQKCGTENGENDNFCTHCGEVMEKTAPETETLDPDLETAASSSQDKPAAAATVDAVVATLVTAPVLDVIENPVLCRVCDTQNEPNAQKCSECGSTLEQHAPETESTSATATPEPAASSAQDATPVAATVDAAVLAAVAGDDDQPVPVPVTPVPTASPTAAAPHSEPVAATPAEAAAAPTEASANKLFCGRCGKQRKQGSKFCPTCGKSFDD